ncbi:MAG TPA: hypothetical protein VF796_10800, partial [Humisphaera sp.]
MSLPINAKFEVPKMKAPPPTRTSLWPSLTPPPTKAGAAATAAAEKGGAGKAGRPITMADGPMSGRATDARHRRGALPKARRLLMKVAIPAIPMLALVSVIAVGCAPEKKAAAPNNPLDVSRPVAAVDPVPAYQPAPAPQPAPQPAAPAPRATKTSLPPMAKPQASAA